MICSSGSESPSPVVNDLPLDECNKRYSISQTILLGQRLLASQNIEVLDQKEASILEVKHPDEVQDQDDSPKRDQMTTTNACQNETKTLQFQKPYLSEIKISKKYLHKKFRKVIVWT